MTLLQEEYKDDPWRLMVCCILLNQTTRKQVDRVLAGFPIGTNPVSKPFFERYPDASWLAMAHHPMLVAQIEPCGLQNRRAKTLITFSAEWENWVHGNGGPPAWQYAAKFTGIGLYAQDSYRMFVSGIMSTRPVSDDKELMAYWREHGQGSKEQAHQEDREAGGRGRG